MNEGRYNAVSLCILQIRGRVPDLRLWPAKFSLNRHNESAENELPDQQKHQTRSIGFATSPQLPQPIKTKLLGQIPCTGSRLTTLAQIQGTDGSALGNCRSQNVLFQRAWLHSLYFLTAMMGMTMNRIRLNLLQAESFTREPGLPRFLYLVFFYRPLMEGLSDGRKYNSCILFTELQLFP